MLGIDVSKASLTCTLVDPGTEKTRWSREFPNTPAGIAQLLRRTPPDVAWVVEPTGPYSKLVVSAGYAAQRSVLLAQTRRAKAFLASETDGLKTDKVDSRGLALYGLARRLPPFPQKSALVDRLDQLQTARKGLSLAISRLQQQAQVLPYAAESLRAAQQDLETRRAALDTEIQALLVEGELAEVTTRLRQVPGIGPVTAAAVVSCLTHKQFTHPDQFVHFIGLSVTHRDSGQKTGAAHLRWQGHAELRRLLFLAAQSNLRSRTSPFRAQYDRERAKGLSSTAALCAVARKLARVCWSLWKHGTEYAPERVHVQPAEHGGRTAHLSAAEFPASTAPMVSSPQNGT